MLSECRRARGRGGVQSGLRSSSLPSWCLSCCGNVYVGAGDKGPLSPTSPLFTGVRGRVILRSSSNGDSANFAFKEFPEVDITALCVAPSLCGGTSYVEIEG